MTAATTSSRRLGSASGPQRAPTGAGVADPPENPPAVGIIMGEGSQAAGTEQRALGVVEGG